MIYRWELDGLEALRIAAPDIAAVLPVGVVLFRGEMAAGKTTIIKALCEEWGVTDTVQSPTFSLVNEYIDANGDPIFHFDFYRIENESEAMDIGVEDYFWRGNRSLVEWPEKIINLLPPNCSEVKIDIRDGVRHVEVIVPDLQ